MSVPSQRLTAADVYHYLDWVAEDWHKGERLHEVEVGGELRQRLIIGADLGRLERVLGLMPEPYSTRALELFTALKRARLDQIFPISNDADREAWREILLKIRGVVSEWDRRRRLRIVNDDREVA